jgi:hypothetical protein
MRATPKALLLLCALVVLGAAQGTDDRRGAPGVEVVGFEWKYAGYAAVEVVSNEKSGNTMKVVREKKYVFKYRAQLIVKNSGAKEIRALDWDYLFIDPEGGKELRRYGLQSKERVAPGTTRALTKEVLIRPEENTHHLTTGRQKVRITRVEFADGSVWRLDEEQKTATGKP